MSAHPKFIAEVSSNHHSDLERCLRFVDVAAEVGCDAVKFQLFKVTELFAPEILKQSAEHRERVNWELPVSFLSPIAKHAEKKGLQFGCTPFYLDAVGTLLPFVDFFKIASYELLWADLAKACSKTGKPIIISTGMATLEEIKASVDVIRKSQNIDLSILHCVSGYPVPSNECNLSAIETIRQVCDCPTGWSDHSVSPAVIYRAINRWGASHIEFHLDLDGTGEEFGPGHCWLPAQIDEVIRTIKDGVAADGDGEKKPVPSEMDDRFWRADPSDGLRPLKSIRDVWTG